MIARRLAKLARIGPRGCALWAEAVAELVRARASLAVRPFRDVIARRGRLHAAESAMEAVAPLHGADRARAQGVGWAVRSVAHWMPFRALCLQQALAADAMLRRRGLPSVLTFGVRQDEDGGFYAHAWVDAGGVRVTGYPLPQGMRAIGVMARAGRRA